MAKNVIRAPRDRSSAQMRKEALKRIEQFWSASHEDSEEKFSAAHEPIVTPMLEAADGGVAAVLEALRAHSDPDARQFIALYDSLSQKNRKLLTLEEIAYAAGIGSLRLAEVAVSAMILSGQAKAKLLIASSMHTVTRSIVKAATAEQPIFDREGEVAGYTSGDTKAMEIFGRISGMVPTPKGANIIINNSPAPEKESPETIEAEPVYLDSGERLRLIHEAVEQRRLPSPPSAPIDIGGRLDHMQADVAEVLSGDV